ncbi:MAG: ATP-binding protein [Symploca sp. SIO2B6]|nr:ATP-binding protein [Symploca sp. SIO2B6]
MTILMIPASYDPQPTVDPESNPSSSHNEAFGQRWQISPLALDATIGQLDLAAVQLETSALGKEAKNIFSSQPLLPGVIIVQGKTLVGMISRQQFFSRMSQPYSLELFLKRPVKELYDFIEPATLILPYDTPINEAVQRSLQRSTKFLYEPILVQHDTKDYSLLDIHQLLLAQAEIHRLMTIRLNEETQAHLHQSEKMSLLGKTIAGVSHEIKNPVNCINGNIGFLEGYIQQLIQLVSLYKSEFPHQNSRISSYENSIDLDFLIDDLPNMLESIDLASNRLVNVVASLRNFSRADREKQETVNIHKYLDGTLLILNSQIKQGIEVLKNYGDIPEGICYPGQISQVFMNLISNAVDALLEKQGRLMIEVGEKLNSNDDAYKAVLEQWRPTIILSTSTIHDNGANYLGVQISDNADGIPQEIQSKIFEPFFTTKSVEKGTGLGLAISRQIIANHDGDIRIESSKEQGTTFEILLPLKPMPVSQN